MTVSELLETIAADTRDHAGPTFDTPDDLAAHLRAVFEEREVMGYDDDTWTIEDIREAANRAPETYPELFA